MIGRFGAALSALAIGFLVPAVAFAKERVNIGVCVSWPGYALHEIAKQQDLAADYDINMVIFDDPLGGHAALAAGQLDVYECTGDYTPLAIDRGTGVVTVAFTNPSSA